MRAALEFQKLAASQSCFDSALCKPRATELAAIRASSLDSPAGRTINRTKSTSAARASTHAAQHSLARHARRFATTSSTLYVDGAAAAASDNATIKTRSLADGSVLAELSDASADDARRAVAAAARCHASGAYFRDGAARRDALERAAAAYAREARDRVRDERRGVVSRSAQDCGKTFAEAEGDVAYCADMLDYYAGLVVDGATKERRAPPPAAYELDAACSIATYPAGVAALVTPWNYPLLQAVLKVAPAVAAGCPFVLKPSPSRR